MRESCGKGKVRKKRRRYDFHCSQGDSFYAPITSIVTYTIDSLEEIQLVLVIISYSKLNYHNYNLKLLT